jgi:hypothetical protein
MVAIPEDHEDLLKRPLYGHPPPMWFDWDGEVVRFTHDHAAEVPQSHSTFAGRNRQDFTSLAMAADASASFFSASLPPSATACVTQ